MKRNNLLKAVYVVLLMAVLTLPAAGCGRETGTGEEMAESTGKTGESVQGNIASANIPGWQLDTSPVILDWYVNYSWYGGKWNTENSKYITEKTGVAFNILVPTGNESEKLNTMIAADQLPDILTLHWDDAGVKKLEAGGYVYPLNELADKYDPYFYQVASRSSLNWYTRDDGNVYGYPNFSVGPDKAGKIKNDESNQTFLVRKDIYEAIGRPDMRTPEGFLNALKMAKERYPDVDGKPLIPFATVEFTEKGAWELVEILQNFLAIPLEKDGKLYDRTSDPEFLRWMKTLRKANEMGLLAADIFIDKRIQFEEKVRQARYFALLVQHTDIQPFQQEIYSRDPQQVYIAIDGPANTNLDPPTLRGGGITGWTLSMISRKCKSPERAIRFFSYMISSEGQKDFFLGRKGVTWDTFNGRDQLMPDIVKQSKRDPDLITKKLGILDTYWMLIDPVAFQSYMPELEEPLLQPKLWTRGKTVSFDAYDDVNPPADSEEGIAATRIAELWGTVQPRLLLAKSDEEFDAVFREYLAERDRLGWEKVMAYKQRKVEINKQKLGIR